jgi:CRP/FNR family transcriptional regulator, anaerobic regulatory protein
MQPPFHRLEEYARLSPFELGLAEGWDGSCQFFPKRTVIRREGDPIDGVFFLKDGWVTSSLLMRSGQKQIVKVHLPGDMLGFPSLALETAGETLEALSEVTLCHISNHDLSQLFEAAPGLSLGIFLSTQKERIALMRQLSWIGGSSSAERMAAFLLDLHDRLALSGKVASGTFPMLLTQEQVGELLGITSIHVNRTIKDLCRSGMIEQGSRSITIKSFERLRALSPDEPPTYAGEPRWRRLGGK